MKIAIPADGRDLKAQIANRLGRALYLIIINLDSGDFEAIPLSEVQAKHRTATQVLTLIVSKGAEVVLCGYCNPRIQSQLVEMGIRVFADLGGTIETTIENYHKGSFGRQAEDSNKAMEGVGADKSTFLVAIKRSIRQLINLLPILISVVLLIGLFHTFISGETLGTIFSGNTALDTLWGTCFGSILAGNPINSYVIGSELLKYGVSLFAVTAFIVAWVTIGLVQIPAEIASLGMKFALTRNILCFILTIPLAILTVLMVNLINGLII